MRTKLKFAAVLVAVAADHTATACDGSLTHHCKQAAAVKNAYARSTVNKSPSGNTAFWNTLNVNRALWSVTLLLSVLSLAGCAPSTDGESRTSVTAVPAKPWADLIKSTYNEARAPAERDALADGKISESEYAYFQQLIVTCLKKIGVVATWSSDHSLDYTRPDSVSNSAVNKCNRDNGLDLIILRDAMDRNPQQLDENTILVDCLKRVRAVDPGYTPSMLARGVDVDKFINSSRFTKCNADPLHYGLSK